ncbi:hypothetical protein ACFLTP_02465 [Chloroflexota bacterium]
MYREEYFISLVRNLTLMTAPFMINLGITILAEMQNMRILVVDDNPKIVSFVKRGLAYEGHIINTAANELEAILSAVTT